MKHTRFFSLLLCLTLLLGLLAGCGSSAPSNEPAGPHREPDFSAEAEAENGLSSDSLLDDALPEGRKLVRTVSMDAETKDYDNLLARLEEQITALGGYIESRSSYGGADSGDRSISMTVRIPADRLSEFAAQVSSSANVLSTSEQTEDITLQYVDTASRIKALETEQARLLELLASAEDLDSVLLIEERLSEVNYELDRHQSQKRTYDNQVDYATVYLSVWEVGQLTPVEEPSVWTRITEGLRDSLRSLGRDVTDCFVWFVVELPYLLVWGAIAAAAFFLLRKLRRHRKRSRASGKSEKTE